MHSLIHTQVLTVLAVSVFAAPSINDVNFQNAVVNTHNTDRAKHGVAGLVWDNSLAQYAQDWANNCVWQHSGGRYGENLFGIYSSGDIDYLAETKAGINDAWYGEITKYDFNNPGFSEATGHFTQVVWKGSQRVGCAWNQNDCPGGNNLRFYKFVCEYDPPGNIVGNNNQYFRDNVPRLVGNKEIFTMVESSFKDAEVITSDVGVLVHLND